MTQPYWIFMGVDRSHCSAKLRPAIRYKQFHCMEHPPDNEEIQRRTGAGFVPILISPDDETFQDTTDIIDELEQRFPTPALIPDDANDRSLCRLLELYGDEFFPMVSMRTRWAYEENEQELRRAFSAFSGSAEIGNIVADKMSGYLPALGITPDTIPVIDAHTNALLKIMDAHLEQHPFLLGDRLSLADCTLMGPLYAHLYLDRVTRKQLYDSALNVCMWIERCNRPIPEKMGGTFEGRYPDSLNALINLIDQDAIPILSDMQDAFQSQLADLNPEDPLPRVTGMYSSNLRGTAFSGGVRSYVIWKIQRLAESVESLGEHHPISELPNCKKLLAREGVPEMHKQNFQLVMGY